MLDDKFGTWIGQFKNVFYDEREASRAVSTGDVSGLASDIRFSSSHSALHLVSYIILQHLLQWLPEMMKMCVMMNMRET